MKTDKFYDLLNKFKNLDNRVSGYFVREAAAKAGLTDSQTKDAIEALQQQGKINTDYGVYIVE